MHIRSRILATEFNCGDRPDLYAGTPPLEALRAIVFIAASDGPEFFPCHGSKACAGEIASRRLLRKGRRKIQTGEEEHVRYQRRSKQLGKRLARASRKLGLPAGVQFKKLVPQQEKNFRLDTRRRFCGDRNEGESVGAQEAAGERVSNQSKHHRGRFDKGHHSAESENMLGRDRDIVSARPSTR